MTNDYIVAIETRNDGIITFETNSVEILYAKLRSFNDNEKICVCDGLTGKVLLYIGERPYYTEEFADIALEKCS